MSDAAKQIDRHIAELAKASRSVDSRESDPVDEEALAELFRAASSSNR